MGNTLGYFYAEEHYIENLKETSGDHYQINESGIELRFVP